MPALGQLPPSVRAPLPGEASARWVETLARRECPSLTARRARRAERSGAPHDPIVWAEARGANVRDADGNVFVDLTAGFSVAALGHAHPDVVRAVQQQVAILPHALGDVHPSAPKIELLDRLAALTPLEDARVVLGLNGSDAIAAALKTAMLATGRPGVIAFEGGYHGLMYAPLALCGYSAGFREPFAAQLNPHVRFAPYPTSDCAREPRARGTCRTRAGRRSPGARSAGPPSEGSSAPKNLRRALAALDALWSDEVGAVIVEPMLGRGGVAIAAEGFLAALGERCRARGALLIVDEIFTGLGRTGQRWAHEREDVGPDLICVGKALGGGLPISACIGRGEVMRAWGDPGGEAIHTATFAGNPIGCAAALAALEVIEREGLIARSRDVGAAWLRELQVCTRHACVREVRGRGLLIGVVLDDGARTLSLVRALLEHGYLVLPAGSDAQVLSLTPPLTIAPQLLSAFVSTLDALLEASS